MVFLLPVLVGCAKSVGRVAVVLDNSGSMAKAGTSFDEVKQTLLNTLIMLSSSHEIGLRVFAENGSKLLVPYEDNLDELRSDLTYITPHGKTFIGDSLLDAVDDLLKRPQGKNRLILITDGEGAISDIDDAHEANHRLSALKGAFKCYFIVFSVRQNVRQETPIGTVADILDCDLTVPSERPSGVTLATTLQRIVSIDLNLLWIILSAIAYLTLLMLTAILVFATQFAYGVLPRYARLMALAFIFVMLPLVVSVHIIGLLGRSSGHVWWLAILAVIMLVLSSLGVGKRRYRPKTRGNDDDPFV
jgi:hypothetical protein